MKRIIVLTTLPEKWEAGQPFELEYFFRNLPPAQMRSKLLRPTVGAGDEITGWRVKIGGTDRFVSGIDLAQDIRRLGGGEKVVREMRCG